MAIRGAVAGTINGVALGIVSDAMDPQGKGRVKVRFPSMSNDSFWAQVCVPFGGTATSKPKVSDTVVVAFEYGDPDRPVVLGRVPS